MLFLPKLTNFFRDFFLAELGGYPSLPFCGNCGKQVVDLGVPSHHRHLWKKSAKYVVFDLLPKGGSKEMEKKLRHLRQKATCRVTSGKNVLPCSPWVSAGWTWLEIVKSPGAVVQLHIFLIDVVYQFCCFFNTPALLIFLPLWKRSWYISLPKCKESPPPKLPWFKSLMRALLQTRERMFTKKRSSTKAA